MEPGSLECLDQATTGEQDVFGPGMGSACLSSICEKDGRPHTRISGYISGAVEPLLPHN